MEYEDCAFPTWDDPVVQSCLQAFGLFSGFFDCSAYSTFSEHFHHSESVRFPKRDQRSTLCKMPCNLTGCDNVCVESVRP